MSNFQGLLLVTTYTAYLHASPIHLYLSIKFSLESEKLCGRMEGQMQPDKHFIPTSTGRLRGKQFSSRINKVWHNSSRCMVQFLFSICVTNVIKRVFALTFAPVDNNKNFCTKFILLQIFSEGISAATSSTPQSLNISFLRCYTSECLLLLLGWHTNTHTLKPAAAEF